MVLKRIMPCLLYDGDALTKTVRFKNPSYIGDPINAIKIYNEKEVDELILLDITASMQNRRPQFDRIREFASECFMPFSYGGGVRELDDFARLYRSGVEKVIVNSACFTNPILVREAVDTYASSSVIGSVDFKRGFGGSRRVYSSTGRKTRRSLIDHCRFLSEELGVGEIMLTSVDREGTWSGYDIEVIREIADHIAVPLIAVGGCGSVADLRLVLDSTRANGAAMGSMAVYQKKGMGVLINFPRREDVIIEEEHEIH